MICHFNLDTFEKLKNCSMNEKEAVAPAFIRVQQPLPLLQQLVQFIINGLDLRADNDLTGVFPGRRMPVAPAAFTACSLT